MTLAQLSKNDSFNGMYESFNHANTAIIYNKIIHLRLFISIYNLQTDKMKPFAMSVEKL